MKSKSIITLLSSLLLFVNIVSSQALSKIWYCSANKMCLTIDSTAKCSRINENYGIEDCSRSRYKRKANILIDIMYNNQTILGWQKDKTVFRIDKLTNDSLHLTLIKTKDLAFFEMLSININEQLIFDFKYNGCAKNYN